MAPRKPASRSRRAPVKSRRTYTKRRAPARRSAPRDGQQLLVSGYFEAKKTLTAADSAISYSINVDPKELVLASGTDLAVGFTKGDGTTNPVDAAGVELARWNTFKPLFNQYRVNSMQIKVRVDDKTGLSHPLMFSMDKGNSAAPVTMADVMKSAHKSHSMTQSRREASYGCKNVGQDLDFFNTETGTKANDEKKYLKVFQKLDPASAGITQAEHQVQVILSLTLKDSK